MQTEFELKVGNREYNVVASARVFPDGGIEVTNLRVWEFRDVQDLCGKDITNLMDDWMETQFTQEAIDRFNEELEQIVHER